MGRVKRICYLSPMWAAKVQASLRIRAFSPEPSLLAHTSSESRGTFRQKARFLAPLNGWACAVEICHDGMLEDTNSLDAAHIIQMFQNISPYQRRKKINYHVCCIAYNIMWWTGLQKTDFLPLQTDFSLLNRFSLHKMHFFSVRKNTLCGSNTGPITWISQVSIIPIIKVVNTFRVTESWKMRSRLISLPLVII